MQYYTKKLEAAKLLLNIDQSSIFVFWKKVCQNFTEIKIYGFFREKKSKLFSKILFGLVY